MTTAFAWLAASRARSSLDRLPSSMSSGNSRRNSPSCGVSAPARPLRELFSNSLRCLVKFVSASASNTTAPARPEGSRNQIEREGGHQVVGVAGAGAEYQCAGLALFQERHGIVDCIRLAQDDELSGVDRERAAGRKQRVTAPALPRAAAHWAESRAAPVEDRSLEKTPTWPRAYLYVSTPGRGKRAIQFAGSFSIGLGDRLQHLVADADIGHDRLAAERPSR